MMPAIFSLTGPVFCTLSSHDMAFRRCITYTYRMHQAYDKGEVDV